MKPLISMREALRDPGIFNATGPSWLAWNTLSIAAMGEPLETDEEREIFRTLTGLDREPLERVDELVAVKGRRSGGTSAAARILVYLSALCDYSDDLDAGEVGVALFIAVTAQQADVAFARANGIIQASPLLRSMVVKERADDVELSNGVVLSVRAASAKSLRGVTLVGLCVDEAAHIANEGSSSAEEVLASCRPALATTGGLCVIASSPWRAEGEFFELHKRHFGNYDSNKVLVSRSTSRQTNPELPQSVVDRAMARDPVKARCEYLAEFRTDVSDYVPRALIEAAVDVGVSSRPPVPGVRYACFADAASGISPASGGVSKGDTFSMAIGHRGDSDQVVIDLVYAKAPPFNASSVVAEISAIAKTYNGISTIVSDRFSAGFMSAELQRSGMAWQASEYDKSALYSLALPLFTSSKVRLTDDRATVEQFCLLERKPTSGNRDRIDARGGKSEDSANAVAGVISLVAQPASSADNWIAYVKGEAERAGIERDAIRPSFGYSLNGENRVRMAVPIDTSMLINPSGDQCVVSIDDAGQRYADVLRDDACLMLFSGLPACVPWRECNPNLVATLTPLPKAQAARVIDLQKAIAASRPIDPFDKMGIVRAALASVGRPLS